MADVYLGLVGVNAYFVLDESETDTIDMYYNMGFVSCTKQPEVPFEQQGFFYLLEDLTWEWRQMVHVPVNFNVATNEIKYNVWKDVYRPVTPTMLGAATAADVQSLQTALAALKARVDALTA